MIALYLLALLPGVIFMLFIRYSENRRRIFHTTLGRVLCYLMFVIPIFGVAEYHLSKVLTEAFNTQVSPVACSVITILAVVYVALKSKMKRVF